MRSETGQARLEEGPDGTRITIPGDPLAVRDGLHALFDTMMLRALPEDDRGTAEIVLAEALNNIVEHAYARHHGDIEISMQLSASQLHFRITDTGLPMPEGVLPAGKLKPFAADDDLPEGGFGWFLIRTLSRDLKYCRDGANNLLSFRLDMGQTAR